MNDWIVVFFIIPTIALLLGIILSVAAHFFAVKKDERVVAISSLLPNANCGACGFPGCSGFAQAVVANGVSPLNCKSIDSQAIEKIASILGSSISSSTIVKQVAYVFCKGNSDNAKEKYNYIGLSDCRAKYLFFKGNKGCSYGCLGGGSCAKRCPTNAIKIEKNIAVVNSKLCIGCGACSEVCPTHVIRLIPLEATLAVACNSPQKGLFVKKYCTVGCIGCKICERNSNAKVVVHDFLAQVDYSNNPSFSDEEQTLLIEKCPAKSIVSL